MPGKRKTTSGAKTAKPPRAQGKRAGKTVSAWQRLLELHPKIAAGPTRAERLAQFLTETAGSGKQAFNEDELIAWLEASQTAWPDEAEIDAFLEWLHESRRGEALK